MKAIVYGLSLLLGVLGLLFIVGNQGLMARVAIGAVLLVAAVVLVVVMRLRPTETRVVQEINLSGDVSLQKLECEKCGGHLDASAIRVEAGAVFVACPYCQAAYQIEEAPQW